MSERDARIAFQRAHATDSSSLTTSATELTSVLITFNTLGFSLLANSNSITTKPKIAILSIYRMKLISRNSGIES